MNVYYGLLVFTAIMLYLTERVFSNYDFSKVPMYKIILAVAMIAPLYIGFLYCIALFSPPLMKMFHHG